MCENKVNSVVCYLYNLIIDAGDTGLCVLVQSFINTPSNNSVVVVVAALRRNDWAVLRM
jgi:hypothetical protein